VRVDASTVKPKLLFEDSLPHYRFVRGPPFNAIGLELVAQMSTLPNELFPQGLKPSILPAHCGTAEAVPFQNTIYATSSSSHAFPLGPMPGP
jgi:hypothetical protein